MTDDHTLLGHFIEERSENALSELVRRHLNLVYFAALRQADGATSIAEDATQATFLLLTKKADALFGHPNFAGWLHATACHHARDLVRAAQRRHEREQAAQTTQTITADGTNDDTWVQVRPIIDDALQDLAPMDREAVLLRFFENRPFAEIGRSLELGENAARMRVTRALGHLEIALSRRGVTSTATALASILVIPAGMTAPVHLAPQISASLLTMPVLATIAAPSTILFNIMTPTKLLLTAASVAAACALTSTLYFRNQLQLSKFEVSTLHQRQIDLQAQVKNLQVGLAVEKKRSTEADADNDKLLALTANMLADQSKQAKPQEVITHDMVQTRFQNAKTLAKAGRNGEALL